MARATFQQQKGAKARALFDQGLSCSQIATQLKVSKATVSRWAKSAGLRFDRAQTAAATEAKQVDLAAARLDLANRLYSAAGDMLDMLDKPFTVFNFGGKDNTFNEATLDSPPVDARRTIITSTAIVFDKLTRIVEKDSGGLEAAVGVLDSLADSLSAAAELVRAEGEAPVDEAA